MRRENSQWTKNIPHFGIFLCCNEESDCNLWTCKLEQKYVLVHRTNEQKNVHKEVRNLNGLVFKTESFFPVYKSLRKRALWLGLLEIYYLFGIAKAEQGNHRYNNIKFPIICRALLKMIMLLLRCILKYIR